MDDSCIYVFRADWCTDAERAGGERERKRLRDKTRRHGHPTWASTSFFSGINFLRVDELSSSLRFRCADASSFPIFFFLSSWPLSLLLCTGQCSSLLHDLASDDKLWHDLTLLSLRRCGSASPPPRLRFYSSWAHIFRSLQPTGVRGPGSQAARTGSSATTASTPGDSAADNGCNATQLGDSASSASALTASGGFDGPLSARRGIVSEHLQQQWFYKTLDLGEFTVHDRRMPSLSEEEWGRLDAETFAERYTSQGLPVGLKGLCKSWPVCLYECLYLSL